MNIRKILLNFYYLDKCDDPEKQFKPAVWQGLSFNILKDSVYEYAKRVIKSLD